MVRAEIYPRERPSPWPHIVWATFVIGVVAVILVAAGQTHMSEGDCSGIGFGCSLYGADVAGFLAIIIVPPAIGILVVGHALIAATRRIARHHHS